LAGGMIQESVRMMSVRRCGRRVNGLAILSPQNVPFR